MKNLFVLLFLIPATIATAFNPTIPVLHLPDYAHEETREQFLAQLETAASEVGFFALSGTGVDPELLDRSYEQIVAYFDQDRSIKHDLLTTDGQRGYVPGESAKGDNRIDFKEFFHVGRELSDEDLQRLRYCKNVWPEHPEGFKPAMQELYQALDLCKEAIGEILSSAIEKEPGYFNSMIREGDCLMRAIHYPGNPPANSIWAAAHTDINFFTILPRSTAKGLQILNKDNEWIDVIVPNGAFIVNCGDMLENLTNGHFRSAQHRVVDAGQADERYSVVFFVHPRSADRLDPLPEFVEKTGGIRTYANVNRIELLAERLIDLGLASYELMEFFVESGAIERLREVNRLSHKAEEALTQAGFSI